MKPGLTAVIAGGAFFFVGAIVVPLAVILPLVLGTSGERIFRIPGEIDVAVVEPGRYYLWHYHETVFQGASYNKPEALPDGLTIQISNAATGEPFAFQADASMSSSGSQGAKRSIGFVEIPAPCTARVSIAGGGEDRVVSFARGAVLKVLGMIAGGVFAALIACLAGAILAVIGIVKLNRREPGPATVA